MASIDNALTTVARAKSYLDLTGSSYDLKLTMLILAATQYIQDTYCQRKFKHQTFTQQLYNGNGSPRLYLKNRPIIQGQTLTVEERHGIDSSDDWETLDSDDYYVDYDTGKITLVGGRFAEGTQNYRITYTAGYYLPSEAQFQDGTDDEKDLPYDLELAVLDMVSTMYGQTGTTGAIQKEKVGQVEVTYANDAATAAMQPHIKKTLDTYKRMSYA